MPFERVDVAGPARRVPDAVDPKVEAGESDRLQEAPRDFDYLRVDRRVAVAERLDPELVVLTVPPGLRTFIAEHRTQVEETDRLRKVVHSVLEECPADGSRALRAQRQEIPSPVFEGVRLLFDDVGHFADSPDEQPRVLEHRRVDASVPEAVGRLLRGRVEASPVRLLVWQDVEGASWQLERQVSLRREESGAEPDAARRQAIRLLTKNTAGGCHCKRSQTHRERGHPARTPPLAPSSGGDFWITLDIFVLMPHNSIIHTPARRTHGLR